MAKSVSKQENSSPNSEIRITVTEKGPYLVFGHPPLATQHIMTDTEGESWYFRQGQHFSTDAEPTALCRCGHSRRKPYCDGIHEKIQWDPTITSPAERMLDHVEITEGQRITLNDNEKYCVFARFCHPRGGTWALTETSRDTETRKLAVRQASMCPSGRLTAWDNRTGKPYEFRFEPSLGLIEDPSLGTSGGLWVRGGIRIQRQNGSCFETRNRVVLCRCGQSGNKPYCDGTHAATKWTDELQETPDGETLPKSDTDEARQQK